MVNREFVGNRNQTGVDHAIAGGIVDIVPHVVPTAALGDHVLRQPFICILQNQLVVAAQHILADFAGQHHAVIGIVQPAVAILFFGGVGHRVVDTKFGPGAGPRFPARIAQIDIVDIDVAVAVDAVIDVVCITADPGK